MNQNIEKICVFCSSSDSLDKKYYSMAERLGELIGNHKLTLVHGGGKIGLMGVLARSVQKKGGKVIGVIPEKLNMKGVASETDDELIVTRDLRERKAKMHELSDAFITLPGGFGTLEEVTEALTLKQLKYHTKPIVIINTDNYYGHLFQQFEMLFAEKFTKAEFSKLYHIAPDPENALEYIQNYQYENIMDKWL
jgi:cytokinin riboside 5'-monophosphate phosphoribohydrolase